MALTDAHPLNAMTTKKLGAIRMVAIPADNSQWDDFGRVVIASKPTL